MGKTKQPRERVFDGLGEFKIESGIPIPVTRMKTGLTKALRKLKPGDSVFLPTQSAYRLAYKVLGRGNAVVRSEKHGYRVWRLK